MKRYKMRMGDLKVVDEHPAGDLVSLSELKDWLENKIEHVNGAQYPEEALSDFFEL